jgi:hypothetical protein
MTKVIRMATKNTSKDQIRTKLARTLGKTIKGEMVKHRS